MHQCRSAWVPHIRKMQQLHRSQRLLTQQWATPQGWPLCRSLPSYMRRCQCSSNNSQGFSHQDTSSKPGACSQVLARSQHLAWARLQERRQQQPLLVDPYAEALLAAAPQVSAPNEHTTHKTRPASRPTYHTPCLPWCCTEPRTRKLHNIHLCVHACRRSWALHQQPIPQQHGTWLPHDTSTICCCVGPVK